MAIFLSSSSDSTVAGDKFTLKKDDLSYSDALTATNSINFEVQVIGEDGTISTFDGTDRLDDSNKTISQLPSNFIRLYDNTGVKNIIFSDPGHGGLEKYYRSYNGTMQVKIQQSDVTLASGKYEGDIYIHVIVEK